MSSLPFQSDGEGQWRLQLSNRMLKDNVVFTFSIEQRRTMSSLLFQSDSEGQCCLYFFNLMAEGQGRLYLFNLMAEDFATVMLAETAADHNTANPLRL